MTKHQKVTLVPTVLADTVEGTWYSIHNDSSEGLVFVATASSVPDADTDSRFPIDPGEIGQAKAASGESIYIWGKSYGLVQYEEAE